MITRRGLLGGLGAASLATLTLAACVSSDDATADSASDDASEAVTIRIGQQTSNGGTSIEYVLEQGVLDNIFEGYDVTFEFSEFVSGPAENEAFAAGELDFAEMGSLPAFTGSSSDYGYKIVAGNAYSEKAAPLVATVSSGIAQIADLEGKTIGTYIGGAWHYDTVLYLQQAGLTEDDVELLNTTSETASGIRTESLDAGVLGAASAYQLESEGSGIIISEETGKPTFSVIAGATDFTSAHPEVTVLVLKAYDTALRYIDENRDDYLSYLEELTGTDTSTIASTWDRTTHYVSVPGEKFLDAAEGLLTWMQENDYAETGVTVDDLFDTTFAEAAGLETSD